jgi:hypothetical protein
MKPTRRKPMRRKPANILGLSRENVMAEAFFGAGGATFSRFKI